jgi:very-short-patch-repair endonuclease
VPDLDWYLDHVVVPGGPTHEPVGPIRAAEAAWAARARELSPNGDAAARAAVAQGFVPTPAQARAAGLADTVVRGRVRRGEWDRPRHGVLSVVPTRDDTRLAVAATAAALVRPGHVISHRSAAVLHGLPLLGRPDMPELTGPADATHGRRYAVAVRPATLSAADVTTWYGAPVTTIARTVIDLARLDRRDGLIAADAARHERVVTPGELEEAVRRCAGWPGARAAREVVARASPLAESPLESLVRLCVLDAGLPAPQLQVRITDPADGWWCRVDLLWPGQRVVLEADGKVKYTNAELWREKRRQLRLERLGYRVVRAIWSDVAQQPDALLQHLRLCLGASPMS